jgi:hypothetical protein
VTVQQLAGRKKGGGAGGCRQGGEERMAEVRWCRFFYILCSFLKQYLRNSYHQNIFPNLAHCHDEVVPLNMTGFAWC